MRITKLEITNFQGLRHAALDVSAPVLLVAGHNATGKSYRHELDDDQHRDLAAFLKGLSGMVVLSGYPCPLYDRLYRHWHRLERNALADGARDRIECLWLNDAARSGLAQLDIFHDTKEPA